MTQSPDISVSICPRLNDAPFAYSMTYDEGTIDTLANALPVHEQFNFPGHVDVVAGQLGQRRHCHASSLNGYMHMGAAELKMLIEHGWGVGNHSWSHYVHPTQPGLNLFREVVWSKYRLEDTLDYPVRIFTIPNDTHNYEPVIDLVKQHYLACVYIEGGPNRDGFDRYKIGNCMVASEGFRPRAGWPEEMKTQNLTLDFVKDSWILETTHLCMWNVPQAHKCVTPQYLTQRFEKLNEISDGTLWAAKPDDVIDYTLLRRGLKIDNIQWRDNALSFDINGNWPVGICNAYLTLKISCPSLTETPRIEQQLHPIPGGYSTLQDIRSITRVNQHWLITMQLAPYRTVIIR